jgi:hypothetical protein
MAALVQAYPQQSSTITMLQTRPSSASGILQTTSQAPSHHPYPSNPPQMNRNSFHGGLNNNIGGSTYRGNTIAPYAFTSTPNLAMPGQRTPPSPHLRSDQRTSSAPIVPTFDGGNSTSRSSRYPAPASISTTSSSSSSDLSTLSHKSGSRDDSSISSSTRMAMGNPRPHSTISIPSSSPNLALLPSISMTTLKPSPDRYRRPNNRRAESSPNVQQTSAQAAVVGSAMPNVMQFYGSSTQQNIYSSNSLQSFSVQMPPSRQPGTTVDDLQINRGGYQEQAKRYRRRSIHTIEPSEFTYDEGNSVAAGLQKQGSRQVSSANGRIDQQQHPLRSSPIVGFRPTTSHGQNGSSESVNSVRGSQNLGLTSVSFFRVIFLSQYCT